jgi:16S rRNA (uracil1498-N3)-methyltransferase
VTGGFAAHVFVDDLETLALDADDARHLFRVRRLRVGERVSAGDGEGRWRPCVVEAGGSGVGLVPAGSVVLAERPSPVLTVGFAVVKGERPESVVQKLSEAGVDRIIPLVTERSVVGGDRLGPGSNRLTRLARIAREAAMQSRRAWLPVVSPLTPLAEVVAEFEASGSCGGLALAAPGGQPPALSWPAVLVGPEGGWSPGELSVALPHVAFGDLVYRSETAAVVAGSLLAALRAGLVAEAGAGGPG